MVNKKIVCLGGGIGTVNLIKGLQKYTKNITTVISMADEGGSSGRLRRLYNILPPGDLVSCMSALVKNKEIIPQVLTYRFPGDRYGDDKSLGGHKLGNLIMTVLWYLTKDYNQAISIFKEIFDVEGEFYPATDQQVSISAITADGKKIVGEEKIDLGKYSGKRILKKVILHPANAGVSKRAIESLKNADSIIVGPGDLYTTLLPVLIIKDIVSEFRRSKKLKIFIVNVANKPFETKGYSVSDYIKAVKDHMGFFPFDKVVINTNFSVKIPKKYHYHYVRFENYQKKYPKIEFIKKDLIDENFPLYHSSDKLAKAIIEKI